MPTSPIPDWYAADWAPARTRWELPQMTWEAVEAVVEHSALPPARKAAAKGRYQTLWATRSSLLPMELLQRFLMTTALAFDPGRTRPGLPQTTAISPSITGPLPRWGFTDLEVALSYTWSETALFVATERHHDLLNRRGEPMTPIQTVRQIVLLVSGLPTRDLSLDTLLSPSPPLWIHAAA